MTTHELSVTRFIRAPRKRVYDAFVNTEAVSRWICPRGLSVPECAVDARVGGRYRLTMLARDGDRFTVGGTYRELAPPERVVFTWQWEGGPTPAFETLVSVTLVERDGGTEVRLVHSGFPDAAMREAHLNGWKSSINHLSDLCDERGTAASVVLLGDPRSTYVRTARMALAEKKVAYTHEVHGPHTPAIDAIHPWGKIPAFRDGDIALFETSAIVRYVDEGFDGPRLAGSSPLARAISEQWVSAVNSYLYPTMVGDYILQYVIPRGADGKPDRAKIDQAVAAMPRQLDALEKAYGGREWIAGMGVSSADLFLAPILAYLGHFPEGKALLETRPAIRRAHAVMAARESFKSTQPTQPQEAK